MGPYIRHRDIGTTPQQMPKTSHSQHLMAEFVRLMAAFSAGHDSYSICRRSDAFAHADAPLMRI